MGTEAENQEINGLLDELEESLDRLKEMTSRQAKNFEKLINDAIAENRLCFKENNFYITVDGKEHAIYRPEIFGFSKIS